MTDAAATATGEQNATSQTNQTQSASQTQTAGRNAQTDSSQAQAPVSFINPDGTLKEGWQNSDLVPQDFRGRPVYNALGQKPTYADLFRHIGHQDIAISKQGKGIFVPGPEATQTEKDMFYKAIGRPDKPEGYAEAIKSAIPKGMEAHYDDAEMMGGFQSAAHQIGLTPQQAASIIAFDAQRTAKAEADIKENPLPYFEELLPLVQPLYQKTTTDELKKRWGDNYDARMNLFQRAIVENTKDDDVRQVLLTNCERDPLFMDLLATIMNKSFTAGMGPDTSFGNPVGAKISVQQQIDSIMRNPIYLDANLNPKEHDRLIMEVNRLISSQTGGKMLE
jgi:hypothetical protein